MIPFKELYFSPKKATYCNQVNRMFSIILLSASFIILIFAVINYINLTVAQSLNRAKEVSTRRLLGSSRTEIFLKFITESVLICSFSFIIGIAFAQLLSPAVSTFTGITISIPEYLTYNKIITLIISCILLGIISGLIPAVIISRYKPIEMTRGYFTNKSRMGFSRFFIIFQNAITIILVGAGLTVIFQLKHILNIDLGYDTENILYINNSLGTDSHVFANEIEKLPFVDEVAFARNFPMTGGRNDAFNVEGRNFVIQTFEGDSAFFKIFGFEILHATGRTNGFWITEKAANTLEVDKETDHFTEGGHNIYINGIIKDVSVGRVDDEMAQSPFRVYIHKSRDNFYPCQILVKINGNPRTAYNEIEKIYNKISSSGGMTAIYLDDFHEYIYMKEKKLSNLIWFFTIIAAFISMLGLIAMSYYFIGQRRKEIAVRKIFGSTSLEALKLIIIYFMKLTGIAFIASIPVLFFLMRYWLNSYPVRLNITPGIFIAAGIFAAVIAFLSIYIQSYKAANRNPVSSIYR